MCMCMHFAWAVGAQRASVQKSILNRSTNHNHKSKHASERVPRCQRFNSGSSGGAALAISISIAVAVAIVNANANANANAIAS